LERAVQVRRDAEGIKGVEYPKTILVHHRMFLVAQLELTSSWGMSI